MNLDWLDKLQRFLQTMAFCLAIAAIQVAFQPSIRYEGPLIYSVCIGISTWGLIDFGRHAFPSAHETGWPQGIGAVMLPLAGVIGGYFLGTLSADTWFGQSSWAGRGTSQILGSVLITALAGTAITYFFYTKGKRAVLESKMAEAKAHASESKLKLLQTQIEPHMLFNTLANLRVLISTDATAAVQMLDRMNDYLRATLNASRATAHPLQTEFDRLRDYLELMSVRMGPRLQFKLDLPPDLANISVPTLLLQPLVENSIKHGLELQIEGGGITVRASTAAGALTLEVADTGAGMSATHSSKPGGGFGLSQVRERLVTAYGDQARVQIAANEPQGTRITITLPMKTNTP
jgi:signal transduction histidine kinase